MQKLLLLALMFAAPVAEATRAPLAAPASSAAKAMPRTRVQSSNIASIGYDNADAILEVEFIGGAVYQYYGVPRSIYQGLMSASSHGTYLAKYVKGRYRYREI